MKKKNIIKKLLSVILSAATVFSLLALPAHAIVPGEDAYTGATNYIRYDVKTGTYTSVEIPEYHAMFPNMSVKQAMGTQTPSNQENVVSPAYIYDEGEWEQSPNGNPYSGVVLIIQEYDTDGDDEADDFVMGSGFMVSPNVMVTAAHCVSPNYAANGMDDVTVISTTVYQGVNVRRTLSGNPEDTSTHLGYLDVLNNYTSANPQVIYFADSNPNDDILDYLYFEDGETQYDWCVVVLDDSFSCTYFDYACATSALVNQTAELTGYPNERNDKDNVISYDRCFYRYTSLGTILSVSNGTFLHNINCAQGQSGGPIFIQDSSDLTNYIAYGICSAEDHATQLNIACAISNGQLFDLIFELTYTND